MQLYLKYVTWCSLSSKEANLIDIVLFVYIFNDLWQVRSFEYCLEIKPRLQRLGCKASVGLFVYIYAGSLDIQPVRQAASRRRMYKCFGA